VLDGGGRALNGRGWCADEREVDASAYALVHGMRRTRATLAAWRSRPWPVLGRWLGGAVAVAGLLLVAVVVVAVFAPGPRIGGPESLGGPPFVVGTVGDLVPILRNNLLVLALHAMACVAGFIAGSSLPLQAPAYSGWKRAVHERGRPIALACVVGATAFSLSMQAWTLGRAAGADAVALRVSPALLLAGLLPHAMPELMSLFLPLAAWMVASRRGEWDGLLAATIVTVALAVPVLIAAAVWEVWVAPHVLVALVGHV
jgi:hypothetical protein